MTQKKHSHIITTTKDIIIIFTKIIIEINSVHFTSINIIITMVSINTIKDSKKRILGILIIISIKIKDLILKITTTPQGIINTTNMQSLLAVILQKIKMIPESKSF